MICYVLFVFSLLVSAGGERETPAYKPTDVFLINCGTWSNSSDTTGQTWTPGKMLLDQNIRLWSSGVSFTSMALKEEPSVPLVPYMTALISRSKFTYSFTVSPGWKFLRLHFYRTRYTADLGGGDFNTVNSFFSVNVNGFTLLRKFKPKASGSGFLIKEFIVPVLGGHNNNKTMMMNLTFTPSSHSLAFINGIEIVSMPDRLYTKGGFDDKITDVGKTSEFKIDDETAFETVYRLKVAGKMVGNDIKENVTGMFRRWLPDDNFIKRGDYDNFGTYTLPLSTINYTEKTPPYVAPKVVYSTHRSLSNRNYPELTPDFSMKWLLPVDAGFNYLVRLHFCETLDIQRGLLFSIFINKKVAKPKTDVFQMSGGFYIPMYLDFHTFLASSHAGISGKRPNLRLDLRPYKNQTLDDYSFSLSAIEVLKLNDTKGNLATLGGKLHVLVIIRIVVGSAIGLTIFIVVLVMSMRKLKRKENSVVMFKVPLKKYTYADLRRLTKSFSHSVGKGGFGIVYGGNLCNGVKVAVKVLKDLKGNGQDFINEVATMSQTSHVNIVTLLGFCYEGSKRAIVYEFLENGSLDQFISKENSSTLDVTTLYRIALGIARGLEYLHYGCKTRIVHFDIKPQNILLDENLCPKVSDFGLAKLCEKRESIVSLMDARGTIGYIAPEVFSRMYGGVSYKSDVYSYGMLVLEMIGARNKETAASSASTAYFPDWIYKDLENGEQTWRFGDEITGEEKEIVKKMILVGLWCIQPCPLDRPPMNRVVEMMEGSLDALEVPPNPSMHISTGLIRESSSLSDSWETGKTSNGCVPPSLTEVKSNEIVEYIN